MVKRIFLVIGLMFFSTGALASDCPIIFVHGHKSEARPEGSSDDPHDKRLGGWGTWYPRNYNGSFDYHTVMTRIINSHYGGYSAGSPLNCSIDSTPRPTNGETRKIYNFSYYNPDGSRGAIGTNGRLWPTSEAQRWIYEQNINNACWAKHLADFIDKVRTATGASKVDIVAHSMGGLVARSAIKYYGCASKVRKLLMIGTPNRGFDIAFWEFLYEIYNPDQWWQWNGENIEMNVGSENWYFKDTTTSAVDIWCNLLGYGNEGVHLSTIAGNRKVGFGAFISDANDGLVLESWVKMGSSADFEPTIYASHSYDGKPELALTTCTYTEEFIKNWIIDDDISHKGATYNENCPVFPSPWGGYELRFYAPISDYSKALAMTAVLTSYNNDQNFLEKFTPAICSSVQRSRISGYQKRGGEKNRA